MAVLRSPGVVVREKDLTNGRADIANSNIAGFVAPFSKGEIGEPQIVSSESDLIKYYGEPTSQNAEYWLSATNYLAYGGTLSVVRTDATALKNSVARVGSAVNAVSVTNPSLNGKYVTSPTVTFSGGGGSGAAAVANIDSNGRVFEIVVTDTGSGYSTEPTVTVAPVGTVAAGTAAAGTTATAEASGANISGGSLTGTLSITNAGSGYSSSPNVTLSGGGGDPTGVTVNSTIVNGQITELAISGGTGYTSAPTITITPPTGVVVTITSPGSNYDPTETYSVNVSGGASNTPFTGTLQVNQNGSVTGVVVASNVNFGDYTNTTNLSVVIPEPGVTATATASISAEPIKINNFEVYEAVHANNTNGWLFAGKTAGSWSNGIRVAVVDNGPRQSLRLSTTSPSNSDNIVLGEFVTSGSKKGKIIDVTSTEENGVVSTFVHIIHVDPSTNLYVSTPSSTALFSVADTVTIGSQAGNTVITVDDGDEWYRTKTLYAGSTVTWNSIVARPVATDDAIAFSNNAFGRDAVHVAIVDTEGLVTGAKNTVLETYTYTSKAWNARGTEGGSNYFKNIVSTSSEYVYSGDTPFEYATRTDTFEPVGAKSWALSAGADYPALSGGGWNVSISDITGAYDYFRDLETVTLDYLIMGPGMNTELDTRAKLNHIASIAALRKDCIAFGSPFKGSIISGTGVPLTNNNIVRNLKSFFEPVGSNSYLVLDCNYKYVYDRWNDLYRYIPCNTDVAGLVADTAIRNEPWFSPAGFSRGGIRNAAKLAWNPSKTDRDELYANRINPIAIFPGQGAVLFGDKTALSNPSAFDRINVRKLFLVLERAIEQAAKAQLFEINDDTTRNVFKAVVEPFLRDVQARRGIYDFLVVCDSSNNTTAVIDNNEFVAEIYVQPARSLNFITLTFTATRTGISFSEAIAR